MPRIAGIEIPENKRIEVALTYIYGIGPVLSKLILEVAKVDLNKRAKDLTENEINEIKKAIEKQTKIEGDLRRQVTADIKRLKEIRCWRGIRHSKGLPVRGQKTRKNSRTVRGNVRKTVGSGKKAAPAPK
ncbi:30S ribosomal protein S13 [bacterium (Candidatus Gribaldobacteria) CG23_combo_of_CG06-09_8_20_14_all_37_87_8]|uniref:Small ribosomal subunit protein uS13 n=2 Tax=Candidatus Gribaldobacteria TaxID=2798536 RepID=A0A2G9ZE77_9BACT|nr:MAG: 30S ribosomal protein S13 [Parcubacteria group bacterium CG1_02_37_13]PIP31466.1 MAG: 30S ribosomal protein S13 [bacterium (Candidatus Gribaldobacteria) CG23_combo_of_CG06-09_8_20_14_all_37_87_8]PIR90443.1 MAG: 30S ribosomal protein S13 [bacterium (Candidatus Gribaldobacteria) CG10_big_fil_rev_8_21_14_0_10_37_21]